MEPNKGGDPKYETIKSADVEYGQNKFLEVALKRIMPEGNEFINISKGYFDKVSGDKRYQKAFGFPKQQEIVQKLKEKLDEVSG